MSIDRSFPALSLLVTGLTAAVGGCSAEGPSPDPGAAGAATQTAPAVQTTPAVRTSGAAGCTETIDHVARPPGHYRVIAGAVALPASDHLLEVQPRTPTDGPAEKFAEWGLLIRAGATATLAVDPGWTGRAGIGWGGDDPATTITVTACPPGTGDGGWSVFAGGTWVAEADCVPIRVESESEQVTVEMSIGALCSRPGG